MSVNIQELKQLDKFWKKHKKVCRLGGKADFEISYSHGSGIGKSAEVKCSCGYKEDVTDYSKW